MPLKKKLLLIMTRFPSKAYGGALRSYYILKILAKHFEVHLVIISDISSDRETVDFLNNNSSSYRIFIKSKVQCCIAAIKSILNNKPIQVNYYHFKDVQRYINAIINDFDLAVAILNRAAEYIKDCKILKYLDMVDSLALNYANSAKKVKSVFWKIIYNLEASRLFNYEKKCIEKFNSVFFVNIIEEKYWRKYGPTVWIPNGVKEELLGYDKFVQDFSKHIVFLGKMDYQPNIDAVLWFCENVLDKLDKSITFNVIGVSPPKKLLNIERKSDNFILSGFMDDPYLILNSALCVVAPMQTGGGIQNKILESMALGQIVITTSYGATPIVGAENKKHLLIEDDHDCMANLINDIHRERNKYEHIGISAKKFISIRFTWDNNEKALLEIISKSKY